MRRFIGGLEFQTGIEWQRKRLNLRDLAVLTAALRGDIGPCRVRLDNPAPGQYNSVRCHF